MTTYSQYLDAWPSRPELTKEVARVAAKKLWRKLTGQPWKHSRRRIEFTSGKRNNRMHSSRLVINPDRGWPWFVWCLTFYAVKPPYDHKRTALEMIQYVVDQGWLSGRPATKKRKPPETRTKSELRLAALETRVARWEGKRDRAVNALKKLYSTRTRLSQQISKQHRKLSAAEFILEEKGEGL